MELIKRAELIESEGFIESEESIELETFVKRGGGVAHFEGNRVGDRGTGAVYFDDNCFVCGFKEFVPDYSSLVPGKQRSRAH